MASVTTGAQSVVYSGAAGGGDFGKAAARAAWHRDQRGAAVGARRAGQRAAGALPGTAQAVTAAPPRVLASTS